MGASRGLRAGTRVRSRIPVEMLILVVLVDGSGLTPFLDL